MLNELNHKHRYPWPVIETAVFLYVREQLTYRAVKENMLKIGVYVSHKNIGEWVYKFAGVVKIKSLKSIDSYFIEESNVRCNGKNMFMYQAINDKKLTVGVILREKKNIAFAKKHFSNIFQR